MRWVFLISNELRTWATAHNLIQTSDYVAGNYRDLWFNVRDENAGKRYILSIHLSDPSKNSAFYNVLNSLQPQIGFTALNVSMQGASFFIAEGAIKPTPEQVDAVISAVTTAVDSAGLLNDYPTCAVCGMPSTHTVEQNHIVSSRCDRCLSIYDVTSSKKGGIGSYLLGALGALLGGVVGAIPWYIVSEFGGWYVGILAYLIGLASFFGYRLFKGPKKSGYAITVIIFSCLLVVVGSSLLPIIDASVGYYNSFSVENVISYFNRIETSSFLINMAMGLIIAGAGVFSTIKHIAAYTAGREAIRIIK